MKSQLCCISRNVVRNKNMKVSHKRRIAYHKAGPVMLY